jgi:hypothetical protein
VDQEPRAADFLAPLPNQEPSPPVLIPHLSGEIAGPVWSESINEPAPFLAVPSSGRCDPPSRRSRSLVRHEAIAAGRSWLWQQRG